jgi:hypothetical protein
VPYVITDSAGNPIVIPDGGFNRDLSINLVGRNTQDYGFEIAQTQVRLLENFANTNPPPRPTGGQLWFDTSRNVITVFSESTNSWQPLVPLVSPDEPASDYNQVRPDGTMYYNSQAGRLFVSSDNDWVPAFTLGEISTAYAAEAGVGNPSRYGTRLRTIFLEDTSLIPRAVLALTYVNNGSLPGVSNNNEKIMAIFSGHGTFTVNNPDTSQVDNNNISYISELLEAGGIGATIQPGLNLRSDNGTRVALSNVSDVANIAFSVATGNAESFSNVTLAQDLFNANTDSIPKTADSLDLGSANSMFANAFITNIFVGNGVDGSILPNGNSNVDIGSANSSIRNIFVDDITVGGNIVITAPDTDIGSNTNPVNNIFANNIVTESISIDGYTMPTDAGNVGGALFTDGAGNTAWSTVTETMVLGGAGLIANTVVTASTGAFPASTTYDLEVGAGVGIIANASNIEVTLMPFSTSDLSEGANLYYTDARARLALSAGAGIDYNTANGEISANTADIRSLFGTTGAGIGYDASTGRFSLTGTNPFGSLGSGDFVRLTGNVPETVTGLKTFQNQLRAPAGIRMDNGNFLYTGTLAFTGTSGTVTFSQNGVVTGSDIVATSDARVKTDLVRIENALDKVEQLAGYTFKRTDLPEDHARMTGLIAQDVDKVLPEAVVEADGKLSVSYGSMMGLIVEAINELRAEVQELKKGN